ncbi:MAG: hypothetical protein HY904_07510 [Deltaproteobacteria bacterium]|nr:hypothetical protein [Deltaproteobacteria bacterium]
MHQRQVNDLLCSLLVVLGGVSCTARSTGDSPSSSTSAGGVASSSGSLVASGDSHGGPASSGAATSAGSSNLSGGGLSPIEQRIAELAAPYVDPTGSTGKAIGLVVGVSTGTTRTILGFGARTIHGAVARPERHL